ncbi:aldehyde dehydrogenase family protein [Planococcus versutus]|uniref:aldehyde dehydrogenase family protein n=1 Tax=Planococcus versutus TaxID=1302659 RepID=UPI0030840B05
MTAIFESKVLDNPRQNKDADVGPLVSQDRLDKVHEMVKQAVKEGSTVAIGGERDTNLPGFFYKPTLLTNVNMTR